MTCNPYFIDSMWLQPFFEELRELGGCPPQILEDAELLAYFEPILRADFEAVETWEPAPESPLDIPFTVVIGRDDDISEQSARQWGVETTMPLQLHQFSGDHFFLQHHWPEIMTIIAHRLQRAFAAS